MTVIVTAIETTIATVIATAEATAIAEAIALIRMTKSIMKLSRCVNKIKIIILKLLNRCKYMIENMQNFLY